MSRLHGSKDFWIGGLRTEGPAFAAAVANTPPETPVLSCPGWTVTDLTLHLAGLYRWVRSFIDSGVTAPPPDRPGTVEPPADVPMVQFWRQEFDQLMPLLDRLDEQAPAWNWAPQPKKAAFWSRRLSIETAIHRWDAQRAIAAAEPIEAKLAADGVGEVLDTWLPAGRRQNSGQWHGLIQLIAADTGQEWYLRLRGTGVALLDTATILDSEHHARAQVTGSASDLLLALYGRVGFDMLEVSGDQRLLDGLRTG